MKSPRIIIVEADAAIASAISGHVEQLGYSVCGVSDNALKAAALAKDLRPDIVLLDSRLSDDKLLDGTLLANRLASAESAKNSESSLLSLISSFSVPVILLIAADDPIDMQRIARAAKHGYLRLPCQPRELRAAIEVALCKAQLQQRQRDSERWFTDTLHCVNDGVIAVDTEGLVSFLNLAAERVLGVELETVKDHKIEEILHFEDVNTLSATEVLKTGATFGIDFGKWIVNAKLERVPVDHCAAPIRNENDQLIGAVVVIRDAAARIAAEQALRFSEERFRTAFEQAAEGMAIVTMDGRFVQGNPALCKLLQCVDAELQGLNVSDITLPEDRLKERQRLTGLITGSASSLQFERRILPRRGEPLSVLVSISVLLHEDSPFCYLYQFHDLTAQKLAESLEQQRQSMSKIHESVVQEKQVAEAATHSKSDFIASMSHELRTPLNAILGFAQLLDNETLSTLTSDQRHSVENIQRAGWHLLDLINDTLDLEKIESGVLRLSMQAIDLRELLPECIEFISTKADESHIAVSASSDFNFVVIADMVRLRQVILNFLSNAVKYNKPGGYVTVSCSRRGDRVRIAVSDSGLGLSDEEQAHLFEPFNRLGKEGGKIEGSGIGLVIAKNLVESMGGSIGVDSDLGVGSVFWAEFDSGHDITLAEKKVSALSTSMQATAKNSLEGSHTILCVEDNPVNMLVVRKVLKQRSTWRLLEAVTGESGFDIAVKEIPDLILLDIGLPDISGIDLMRRLRGNASTQKIPIVAVSANADSQYIHDALSFGFDRYITKPIRFADFLATIEDLLIKTASSRKVT